MSVDCVLSVHIIKCFNGCFQFYLGLPIVFLRDSKETFKIAGAEFYRPDACAVALATVSEH